MKAYDRFVRHPLKGTMTKIIIKPLDKVLNSVYN